MFRDSQLDSFYVYPSEWKGRLVKSLMISKKMTRVGFASGPCKAFNALKRALEYKRAHV